MSPTSEVSECALSIRLAMLSLTCPLQIAGDALTVVKFCGKLPNLFWQWSNDGCNPRTRTSHFCPLIPVRASMSLSEVADVSIKSHFTQLLQAPSADCDCVASFPDRGHSVHSLWQQIFATVFAARLGTSQDNGLAENRAVGENKGVRNQTRFAIPDTFVFPP